MKPLLNVARAEEEMKEREEEVGDFRQLQMLQITFGIFVDSLAFPSIRSLFYELSLHCPRHMVESLDRWLKFRLPLTLNRPKSLRFFAHVKSCDHTLEKLLYYSPFGIYGQISDGAKYVKEKVEKIFYQEIDLDWNWVGCKQPLAE